MELTGKVSQDVTNRQRWSNRQAKWYKMRHNGLPRLNKPWPTCSDLHFPLVDSTIEKLKPFYFNQLFGNDRVAQFVSSDEDLTPFCQEMAQWFDFKVREESNLEQEALYLIDFMMMSGACVAGVLWDAKREQLRFDAIDPLLCIVPDYTTGLDEADRVTIVHQLSVDQYRRDKRFKKRDSNFVKTITGSGTVDSGQSSQLAQSRRIREGITQSDKNADIVLVWEIWEHVDDDSWLVHWVSPLRPDIALRPSQKNPFAHGKLPFIRFDMEVKDKSHFGSRGVPEKQAPFETSITKWWNEKNDYMTFCNRPIFTSDRAIPNANNLQIMPGSIISGQLKAVQMPPPPVSFDQEMNSTRQTAEYHIGMPDFGVQDAQKPGNPITATEANKISGLTQISTDLRARIFRRSLGELLQLAWLTLSENDPDTKYFVQDEMRELPRDLKPLSELAEALKVKPAGTSESWNKPQQMAKTVARFQMWKGDSRINQDELTKSVLEMDDPQLVKRLFAPSGEQSQRDYEEEGKIIPALMLGMPMQVLPEDDQAARIKCLLDFLQLTHMTGQSVNQIAMKGIMNRMNGHLQQLQQKDPKQAHQIGQAVHQALLAHPPQVVPLNAGAAGGAPADSQPPKKTIADIVKITMADFTPSERAQFLQGMGINPAGPQELAEWHATQHAAANPAPAVTHADVQQPEAQSA